MCVQVCPRVSKCVSVCVHVQAVSMLQSLCPPHPQQAALLSSLNTQRLPNGTSSEVNGRGPTRPPTPKGAESGPRERLRSRRQERLHAEEHAEQ